MSKGKVDLKHYFLVALQFIVLLFALFFSFYLWAMGAVASFIGRNHVLVTGTDPIGAKRVIRLASGIITSLTSKGRKIVAQYVRKHHPAVWQALREQLIPRR